MNLLPKLLAGGVAGATLLLGAAAALAAPGVATGAVNVRSGPGTNYAVRDTLYRGEDVDIGRCTGGWCYVTHDGPDGWVSANYLQGVDDGPAYDEPPDYYPPDYYPPVYAPPVYAPGPVFITPGYPYNDYRYRHRRYNRPPPPPPVVPVPPRAHRPQPVIDCVTNPDLPECKTWYPGPRRMPLQPGNSGNPGNGNHQNGDY